MVGRRSTSVAPTINNAHAAIDVLPFMTLLLLINMC
jgi:hypothetical protein